MRRHGLPLARLMDDDALLTVAKDMHYPDVTGLYTAVGENHADAAAVVARLVAGLGGPENAAEDVAETALPIRPLRRNAGEPGVDVAGASDAWVKLARCCTPMPGDKIVGFVTRGKGVSVHREDCQNLASMRSGPADRTVAVQWAPSSGSIFLVVIQVEALDRRKLLSEVTRVLSNHHVNILSASAATTRDQVAVSRFTFEMADTKHLGHILDAVRTIDGVYDCFRVTSRATDGGRQERRCRPDRAAPALDGQKRREHTPPSKDTRSSPSPKAARSLFFAPPEAAGDVGAPPEAGGGDMAAAGVPAGSAPPTPHESRDARSPGGPAPPDTASRRPGTPAREAIWGARTREAMDGVLIRAVREATVPGSPGGRVHLAAAVDGGCHGC
jgi:hypothetical protein